LAIFLREDALRLLPPASNQMPLLSHPARDVYIALEKRGALFFNELVRATGRLASEVEDGLWELVAAGQVTADGFDNLRALIDPKRRNFAHYREASLVKPNKEEAGLAAGIEIRDEIGLCQAGDRLLNLWQAEAVLVSRGEEGMSLFKRHGKAQHFPTTAREVFDVTGAGDTVLATCALALGAGATLEQATILANHAAGIVVGKVGTATVSPAELTAALQKRKP